MVFDGGVTAGDVQRTALSTPRRRDTPAAVRRHAGTFGAGDASFARDAAVALMGDVVVSEGMQGSGLCATAGRRCRGWPADPVARPTGAVGVTRRRLTHP